MEEQKTIDDIKGLFIEWTNKMDKIYGANTKERTDGACWNKGSPADWMEPFQQNIFDVWLHYDARVPAWEEEIRKYIGEK